MIVLDPNVVSEPMKPNGNPAVRDWLDRQVAGQIEAIAAAHGFSVADGVPVINPWEG